MEIPGDLKYTKDHEWVKVEGEIATMGITDYAQNELGDIVFVELPETGQEVTQNSAMGTIEAVKTVADLFSGVTGEVVEVNTAIEDDPAIINSDPYGEGWLVKIKISSPDELENLLSAEEYEKIIE